MKKLLFLALTASLTIAKPNGYFSEEHQSYAQSSAYNNNELQHKTEDESYYSKHGDLEGRIKPKVNAHSQHSEYVNPKLKSGQYYSGLNGQQNSDLNGYGSSNYGSSGYGSSNHGASNYGSSNYDYNQQSYATQAQLRQSAQSLQGELQHDLNRAIANYQQRLQSLSNTDNSQNDLQNLETELRRNVSTKFQSLRTYQSSQGGQVAQPSSSYNQELEDLSRQTQDHLLKQLEQGTRRQYQYAASGSSHQTNRVVPLGVKVRPAYVPNDQSVQTVYRPEPIYRPATVYRPEPIQNQPVYVSAPVQSNPQPSMDSVIQTATHVQNSLNLRISVILDSVKARYLQPNTQTSQQVLENVLAQIQDDLRRNITEQLQEEFRRTYGYNQKIDNFEDLRRQIENNLITRLNRDFNQLKQLYFSSQQSSYNTNYVSNSVEVSQLKQRLQEQLQRQLQTALLQNLQEQQQRQRQHQPASNYQTTFQELREELNQNLTQQLENAKGQYRNLNDVEFVNLKSELQNDLQRQLQQGLQGSWSRYSSWGSQSSWSYQPSGNNVDLNEVKQQLQEHVQRNVQSAINEQRNNAQSSNYQTTLQHLTNEMNQKLSQQFDHLKSQYSGHNAQFENLQTQLQDDMRNQLQQGLQRSQSSYSSSSSSNSYSQNSGAAGGNYRAVRGYGYGGASSSLTDADCDEQQSQQRLYKRSAKESNENVSHNSEQAEDSKLEKIVDDILTSPDSEQLEDESV